MRNRSTLVAFIVAVILIGFIIWAHYSVRQSDAPAGQPVPAASSTQVFDSSISDGTIIVSYPSAEYGLATNPTQIMVKSYIPPCDEGFMYCLYATSSAYTGTNFESAGLKVSKRADLGTEKLCLETPPAGFDAGKKADASVSKDAYASGVFSSIGDAGAGHYASGSLYRLFYRATGSCYEFETRIGETQFMNYPAGSIKEFTAADRDALKAALGRILDRITLQSGEARLFAPY